MGMASTARLVGARAMVWVGPPLSARAWSWALVFRRSWLAVLNPQSLPLLSVRLYPLSVTTLAPPKPESRAQLPPEVVLAMTVPLSVNVLWLTKNTPPETAELPLKVLFLTVAALATLIAPPTVLVCELL